MSAATARGANPLRRSTTARGGQCARLRSALCDPSSLDMPGPGHPLREFWFPVTFTSKLPEDAPPEEIGVLGERWEVRRDAAGCAAVSRGGEALETREGDGIVWAWPGRGAPGPLPTQFAVPEGHTVHSELIVEAVPCEHGLLMENLLDLAHAPFTHQSTFAKGWVPPGLCECVQWAAPGGGHEGWHEMAAPLAWLDGGLKRPKTSVRGAWNPYPIDMGFEAPFMAISHVGMAQPGAAGGGAQFTPGSRAVDCEKHLYQLHCCVPGHAPGSTRLLYRMALDFAGWAKRVPGIQHVWKAMADQVLQEDMSLVVGQQERVQQGSELWNMPMGYDGMSLAYRRWRTKYVKAALREAEEEAAENARVAASVARLVDTTAQLDAAISAGTEERVLMEAAR